MFVSAQQVREAASKDFNLFSALLLEDNFKYEFPDLYIELFELVKDAASKERDFSKFAFGIPRGFAKTTWAKLVICYLILYLNKRFIGIAAANEQLASAIVSDIWTMLTSDNVKNIYGDITKLVKEDTKIRKVFKYNLHTVAIVGVGAQGSPRGWNIEHTRPDILLLDDVQTRQCAESDTETASLLTWIFSTFLYTASPLGCTTIFLGNMYPGKNSILKMLEQNPAWTSLIVGGILSDGTSLWEELYPIQQLLNNYKEAEASGTTKYFAAEILNDNEAQLAVDFTSRDFAPIPNDYNDIPASRFIIIDPAGRKRHSDKTVIALFDIYEGKPILKELLVGQFDPKTTIQKTLELALSYNCASICIEAVAYQETLIFWFEELIEQFNIEGICLYPINPRKQSKTARIRDAILQLKSGDILVYPKLQAQVYRQISNWKPARTHNEDDILDVLAYSRQVLQEHGDSFPLLLSDNSKEFSARCVTSSELFPLM